MFFECVIRLPPVPRRSSPSLDALSNHFGKKEGYVVSYEGPQFYDNEAVFQTLRPTGLFVFSVEHPVITSCDRAWQGVGLCQEWIVDCYFDVGQRVTHWLGEQVVTYHRMVEEYFLGLQTAGFVVERLRESRPERQWFTHEETYWRRTRIPLCLFFAARKP